MNSKYFYSVTLKRFQPHLVLEVWLITLRSAILVCLFRICAPFFCQSYFFICLVCQPRNSVESTAGPAREITKLLV